VAAPIPDEAPVMTATFPSQLKVPAGMAGTLASTPPHGRDVT
jgi:hypothetical protein